MRTCPRPSQPSQSHRGSAASPRLWLVLCVAALSVSGCQLRLLVDVEVNRDGGGRFSVAVGADEQLLAQAEQAGADPLGDLVSAGESLGREWSVNDTADEAGGRTVTLTAPFANPEELAALSEEVSTALNAPEVRLLRPFSAEITDDTVEVSGAALAVPGKAVRDYGLAPQAAVRSIAEADAFDYQVRVTMPGDVTSSTADTADGSELTWVVEPGDRVDIAAAGTRPGPPILRGVVGAVAGAVLAGALLWLSWFFAGRRRH